MHKLREEKYPVQGKRRGQEEISSVENNQGKAVSKSCLLRDRRILSIDTRKIENNSLVAALIIMVRPVMSLLQASIQVVMKSRIPFGSSSGAWEVSLNVRVNVIFTADLHPGHEGQVVIISPNATSSPFANFRSVSSSSLKRVNTDSSTRSLPRQSPGN